MAMTPEDAQAHAYEPAVTCCRFEAGTVIGPEHLEDPIGFPELHGSGFLQIPDHCLTIREALGATIKETIDGFTPVTPERIRTSPSRPLAHLLLAKERLWRGSPISSLRSTRTLVENPPGSCSVVSRLSPVRP